MIQAQANVLQDDEPAEVFQVVLENPRLFHPKESVDITSVIGGEDIKFQFFDKTRRVWIHGSSASPSRNIGDERTLQYRTTGVTCGPEMPRSSRKRHEPDACSVDTTVADATKRLRQADFIDVDELNDWSVHRIALEKVLLLTLMSTGQAPVLSQLHRHHHHTQAHHRPLAEPPPFRLASNLYPNVAMLGHCSTSVTWRQSLRR